MIMNQAVILLCLLFFLVLLVTSYKLRYHLRFSAFLYLVLTISYIFILRILFEADLAFCEGWGGFNSFQEIEIIVKDGFPHVVENIDDKNPSTDKIIIPETNNTTNKKINSDSTNLKFKPFLNINLIEGDPRVYKKQTGLFILKFSDLCSKHPNKDLRTLALDFLPHKDNTNMYSPNQAGLSNIDCPSTWFVNGLMFHYVSEPTNEKLHLITVFGLLNSYLCDGATMNEARQGVILLTPSQYDLALHRNIQLIDFLHQNNMIK